MKKDKLILVLSQHPVFGWKLAVQSAGLTDDGCSIQILGTPIAREEAARGTDAAIVEMIRLAEGISDQALMKAYSKKKLFADFRRELTEEKLEKYIRPRIQTANRRITEVARRTPIEAFLRESLTSQSLYERFNIRILPEPTHCLFNFIKDERGLRYFISLTNRGEEISLQTEPAIILSEKPCVALLGNCVHSVENIDAKKLTPFFTKEYITVPPGQEENYLQTFVVKTMAQYEVKIQGIPVREIHPEKEAVLSLEKDLRQELALVLCFRYGHGAKMRPDHPRRKHIQLEDAGGTTGIVWYSRSEAWERRLIARLKNVGLHEEGNGFFYAAAAGKGGPYRLVEWLNRKEESLKDDFVIEQELELPYYTGPIQLVAALDEKIDWFDVNITVIIGRYKIPFNRFRRHILSGDREFVMPDRSIVLLPEEWFEQYRDLFKLGKSTASGLQVRKLHASFLKKALEGKVPEKTFSRLDEILRMPDRHPALPVQPGVVLRPYQKEGYYWFVHLYENGFGGCLADDMGLGKTLQAITLMKHVYEGARPVAPAVGDHGQLSLFDTAAAPLLPASLVVAPTSLLHNWQNELRRFAPELPTLVYSGAKRLRSPMASELFRHCQVVITSYGIVRNDIGMLKEYPFKMIVLDESQYIKNPRSLAYRSVCRLTTSHRFVLTGTPVENSLDDLWAQFNFINEGLLGGFTSFRKNFIRKIVGEQDVRREEMLKRLIAPFLLRRTKEEVTPELPPLTQEVVYCSMTEEHQELYNAEKNRIRNQLMEARENPGEQVNTFIALEGLNRLRQLANHPRLIDPDYEGGSGKFEQIVLFFENLLGTKHKVLIFSSYVKHLRLLAAKFDREKWKYAMLTGETVRREEEINRFTTDPDVRCFFISLKAGSTGLNLTAADYVFIIDPWWNPAAEMQALSRAHRIGQDKPVIVYRFISSETVEEKILQLQSTKAELFQTFVNEANPLAGLNWDEIDGLLG